MNDLPAEARALIRDSLPCDPEQLTTPVQACSFELRLTFVVRQMRHLIEVFSAAGPTFLGIFPSIQITH